MSAASPQPGPDVVIDARGLKCPLPVIRLAQAAKEAPDATAIEVLATDPAAAADIPAWCRMRRQELVAVVERGDHTAYLVRVSAPASR